MCQFEPDIGPGTAESTVESASTLNQYRLSIHLVSTDRFVCILGNAHINATHVAEPLNRKNVLVSHICCVHTGECPVTGNPWFSS